MVYFVGSEGEGEKYFMILKVMNSIGQDALVFSSDNQAPNGMLVKKGSSLTIVKTMVSNRVVDFIAMDRTTKARLYLNNVAKLKVTPSHSKEQVKEVTLAPSGTFLRYSNHVWYKWSRTFAVLHTLVMLNIVTQKLASIVTKLQQNILPRQ